MSSEKNSFIRLCCFVTLLLAAVLLLINNVLPLIGLEIKGKLPAALNLIKDIALLFGIAFGAYSFCAPKKGLRITFWIAIVIYVACAICGLF